MKKVFIKSLIIVQALLLGGQAMAQETPKAELGIGAGLGLSTLSYDLQNGSRDGKLGGNISLTGTYFFSKNFGIVSGLEFAMYNSKANFNNLTTSYHTATSELDAVEYRAAMNVYSEKQQMTILNIPIMAHVQTPVSSVGQVYLQGGLKIAIPVSGKFTSQAAEYTTSYYFVDHNVEVGGESGEAGLGTFMGEKTKGDLNKKIAIVLAAETGFKWNVASDRFLYTGIFVDYGLSSMVKTKENKSLVEYERDFVSPRFGANSALSSQQRLNDSTLPVTKKVIPFAVGLKVRFAFACGK